MNMMMVAAVSGHGINSGLPSNEGIMFSLFLAVAGLMLLPAAALMVRTGHSDQAMRYTRSRRDLSNL